jgi:ABC-type enterochelin transport system substrate-binding protein
MIDSEKLGEDLRQNQQDLAFIWKKLDEQQADISEIRTELSKIKQEIQADS